MSHDTKAQRRGELWECSVAAGLRRMGFRAAVRTARKGVGDVVGAPFLVDCKAYSDTSLRPSVISRWTVKAQQQADAVRLSFGVVILRTRNCRKLESAVWFVADDAVPVALSTLPELVPALSDPTRSVALPCTVPSGVTALVSQG